MSDIPKSGNSLTIEFDSSGKPKEEPNPMSTDFTMSLRSGTAHILTEWLQEQADKASFKATPSDMLDIHMNAFLESKLGEEEFENRWKEYSERQHELEVAWVKYEIQQDELSADNE